LNIEQKTITSVEVAEMMNINHWEVLRKLEGTKKVKGIIPTLTDNKIVVSDYFNESTYIDNSGKENKCYAVTKIGCDFLANKYTGEKGILFTAKYVKRFREMEEAIQQPKNSIQLLELELAAIKEVDTKVETVNKDLQDFKQDMPLLGLECDRITTAIKTKGVNCLGGKDSAAYRDKSLRARVYQDMHHQLKREFGVSTYKAIKRSQTDIAVQKINEYQLPVVLSEAVQDTNNQVNISDIA
jgi:Rha family phage regulatory protein